MAAAISQGIRDADDIRALREAGTDAVLIGETLMRAEDKAAKLAELKGVPDRTGGKRQDSL